MGKSNVFCHLSRGRDIGKENFTYLALGSNLGDRRENLELAIAKLGEHGIEFVESSPVYRTPALLLENSPEDWNRPYFNCVIKTKTTHSPEFLLESVKTIEQEMGRDFTHKWSPRTIDIDILFHRDITIDTPSLTIPHKALKNRQFLRDALSFVRPNTDAEVYHYGMGHLPVFMGILNINSDSFSDGGVYNNHEKFKAAFENFANELVAIIDIGAESTKPNAVPISAEEELKRLEGVFEFLKGRKHKALDPILSIDTYHFETAKIAVENGFKIINNVSALSDRRFIELLAEYGDTKYVLTHSLRVPAGGEDVIVDERVVDELCGFLESKLGELEGGGISRDRILFDIGVGFGKSQYGSLKLLREIEKFHKYGVKIVVGHSRKSFMRAFEESTPTKDADTLAISLALAPKVDVLRVHTPIEHQNAFLAYNSVVSGL